MTDRTSPAAIVQAQLDAYNAHDVEALVAIYADDVRHYRHPDTLLASGSAQLRERFTARFSSARPHATLLNRIVCGDLVIDHERIDSDGTGGPGSVELVASYEVKQGRIARAWFHFGPET
ncbi:MAG: nuclear transport factor 2 family protein [Pseudomonadota bacterium]